MTQQTCAELLQHVAHRMTGEAPASAQEQQRILEAISRILQELGRVVERPLPILDFSDIRGQDHVKRALEVAAAGGHHLLLVGPPGSGRRMLARTLSSLLPQTEGPVPCRAPRASMSLEALVGSVDPLSIGELTLAHTGVLLLEDLAQYERAHLDAVRQAVEQQVVRPCGDTALCFPARVLLVATLQPCPCGWYGDPIRACRCTTEEITHYWQRLEPSLAECFDLQIEVPYLRAEAPERRPSGTSSTWVRQRVEEARITQQHRFAGTRLRVNGDLHLLNECEQFCVLEPSAHRLLYTAAQQLHLSPVQYARLLRVARTIADLAATRAQEAQDIGANHIAEAIQYRSRFGM